MKTILGAFVVSLLLFAACGGDGGSTDAPGNPGSNDAGADNSGGADSGSDAPGGAAGKSSGPTTDGGGGSVDGPGSGDGGRATETMGGALGEGGVPQVPNSPVSGHILSMTGLALEGAVVTINGQSTLTDADGAFSLDDVTPKYDLTVIYENEAANFHAAELVDGLTTRDLSLRVWFARFNTSSATVLGKLSVPVAKGHEAIVRLAGEHTTSPANDLAPGAAEYSLDFQWEGTGSGAADLVGLEWVAGETGPASYTGYARKSIQAPDGTGVIANLTLAKPAQKTVAGSLTAAGPTPPDSFLNLGRFQIPLALKAGAFSVVVPEIGETPTISVGAQNGDAYAAMTAPVTPAPVSLEVPTSAKQILPVNKAQVDLNTEFSFTRPGKLAAVWWALGEWIIVRVTNQTKLTLPDLRAAGIVYDTGNDASTWFVDTYAPAETPEDFLPLMDNTSPALTSSVTTYTSVSRSFYLPK